MVSHAAGLYCRLQVTKEGLALACEYTACPVVGGTASTYTYNFHTLQSVGSLVQKVYSRNDVLYPQRFNYLSINATTHLDGPSFLCVGFEALFLPSVSGRRLV